MVCEHTAFLSQSIRRPDPAVGDFCEESEPMDKCDKDERDRETVDLEDHQDHSSPLGNQQPKANPLAEEYGLSPEQTKMFDLYL